jgi:pyrroloquinoline quinone (PQQ) biosynthesis protein C
MDVNVWAAAFGELARQTMSSPELERYFFIPITKARAQLILQQLSLYVRHRRECWSHVSANCPVMGVKQRILEHEYEEIIRDDFSEYGHLHLIIRQGKSVGLEPEEILNAEPTPQTRAALYAWSWMTSAMAWTEALTGMTITEWCHEDRLLGALGGGQSTRMAKKWMEDMGFTWKQIPNMQAHSQADEKHSDMFLPFLAEHATGDKEALAIQAAKDSLAFHAMYRKGIALAQEKIPL